MFQAREDTVLLVGGLVERVFTDGEDRVDRSMIWI